MTDESIRPSKAVLTSGPGAIIDLKGQVGHCDEP